MPSGTLFADAFYWIALIFPRDAHHTVALSLSRTLGAVQLVTTDEVLCEVMSHFCSYGPFWRVTAASAVHQVRNDPQVDVMPQTRASFDAALDFYESRPDKGYSLIDCRSMVAMRDVGISEVLTNDHHFVQEGFIILFPKPHDTDAGQQSSAAMITR